MLTAALLRPGPCSAIPELRCGPWRGWGVCVVIASGFLVGRTASRLSPSWKKSLPQWHRKMNSRTLLLQSPLAAAAALGFTLTALCQVSRRLIPQRRESWPGAVSSALSSCQHCRRSPPHPPSCFLQRWHLLDRNLGWLRMRLLSSSARLRPPPQPPAAATCDNFPGRTGS